MHTTLRTPLNDYVEPDEGYFAIYEAYTPDVATLMRVNMALPQAHVVIPGRRTCPDCLRNIPRMARIAEQLPGWTWEIYNSSENLERNAILKVSAVPTFIVFDHAGGQELGRIVENPASGSLEADLLEIAQAVR
jgi:hypothetical protein